MENNNHTLWKSTMTSGAFLGLALVIFSILLVFLDISKMRFLWIGILIFIPFIILITGIILGTKRYRDSVLDGQITYVHALMVGTLVVLFASIISAFYSYIYNEFIDPGYVEKASRAIMDKMIRFMQECGYSDVQLEQQVEELNTRPVPSAFESALSSIPFNTMVGFLLSLLTSAFLKRDHPAKSIQNSEFQQ